MSLMFLFFFLTELPHLRARRSDTLLPYTTLFRSCFCLAEMEHRAAADIDPQGCAVRRGIDARFAVFDTSSGVATGRERGERITFGFVPAFLTKRRTEGHTYELHSLMRHSYAVFCL